MNRNEDKNIKLKPIKIFMKMIATVIILMKKTFYGDYKTYTL